MSPLNFRSASLAACIALGACADPVTTRRAPLDLQFTLPHRRSDLGTVQLESKVLAIESPAGFQVRPSLLPSTAAAELPPEYNTMPGVYNEKTIAGFGSRNGQPTAWGQGLMDFYGNRARQEVKLSVLWNGSSIVDESGVTSASYFLPWSYSFSSSVNIPVDRACGYEDRASTLHRAWHQMPIPGPWGGEFGIDEKPSSSDLIEQPACRAETKSETRTGGEGDSRIIDSHWQICYYVAWYDQNNVEIAREYLYCTAI